MGLLSWLSDQRREITQRHARAHLNPDEEVLHWVRARRIGERGSGFVYVTERRCIVVWPDEDVADCSAPWEQIETWGLVSDAPGGPILGFETPGERCFAQIRTDTEAQAEVAKSFVQHFADCAPPAEREFSGDPAFGAWETDPARPLERSRRSIREQTRRVVITIIGVVLILAAVLIIPLPGPWSFVLAIGALALLSSEYDWAKDLMAWTKDRFEQAKAKISGRRSRGAGSAGPQDGEGRDRSDADAS